MDKKFLIKNIICPECKKTSLKTHVCTECGLVLEDKIIKTNLFPRGNRNKKRHDGEMITRSFYGPLSVDIGYTHIYAKKSPNEELNRALRRQKEERKKTEKNYYFRDYKNIERICDYLQLPNTVKQEALNIRFQLGKEGKYFNRQSYYKITAIIKIAIKIHDYPINERELLELTKGSLIQKKGVKTKIKGNPVKKIVDKFYVEIIRKLNIHIKPPNKPNFIPMACSKLDLPQECENQLYEIYAKIKKYLNPSRSIKGYVLALIHLKYGKEYSIRFIDLEDKFVINRLTIVSGKKEINKIIERLNA